MVDDVLVHAAVEAEDLRPAGPPVFGHIPWGDRENRITAMARDPRWIFVYWEVTDEALAAARAAAGSPDAGCVLRVYDTTYRLFDGTNAHWSSDVPVDRAANNHYVRVDRPASAFHLDIGVKGARDAFVTIARSGPVETPRNAISSDTRVEWMTVTPEGPPPPYRHRFVPRPAAGEPVAPARPPEIDRIAESLAGEGWERAEWEEADMHGRTVRWLRWTEPRRRVEIVFQGERHVTRTAWGEGVTLGPWRVTIYGRGPDGLRRAIDRWAIRYAWHTEGGSTRVETPTILRRLLGGYRAGVARGGSEARLIGESWASEALQGGASESRWLGASELHLAGASEALFVGASERVGASELRLGGASEARP